MKRFLSVTLASLFFIVLFSPSFIPSLQAAQSQDASDLAEEAESTTHRAPVIVDGRTLFSVRGATMFPAEQRAEAISQRIKEAGEDASISPTTLRLEPAINATALRAGNLQIMRVYDADANLEKVSRLTLGELYIKRIGVAITEYREDRDPRRILVHLMYAGIATLILLGILLGVWWGFRFLTALTQRHVRSTLEQIQSKVSPVIGRGSIWSMVIGLLGLLKGVLWFAAVYAYLAYVLEMFPWTRAFGQRLLSIFLEPLQRIGQGFLTALPGLVFVAIVIVITRFALKAIRLFFGGIAQGRIEILNFDLEWAWPTYKIARVLVIAFAAVVAYPYIPGSNSDAFKGVSLLLGLVFSLGSSSVISNLVAGYSMTYRRTFKLGDIVRVNDVIGTVSDIGLVVTRIRTPKNEDVVMPNSQILSNHVVNYSTLSKKGGLILHTTAGVSYATSWRQVEAMLKLAAERTSGLLKDPPPFILLKELGDFAVTYELNAYCETPHVMYKLYTELHKNILDQFNEHGVQIMTPAYEGDPETPKVVPKDQWYAAPAQKPSTTSSS